MAIIILVLIITLIVACGIAGIYIFNLVVNIDTFNKHILSNLKMQEDSNRKKEREEEQEWLENNSNIIYIEANDKTKLCGYEIKSNKESDRWVIAVHGYMGRGSEMVPYIQKVIDKGYNVLIVDLRAHGKSEGKYRGMSYLDRIDIIKWINTIVKENKNSQIILYGISMGAATVMMAIGEKLPKNVKACIADCGYTSVWEQLKSVYKKVFKLPTFPLLNIASLVSKIKVGYSFKEASPIKALSKTKIPILLIHGENDNFVPTYMVHELYEVAASEKEKLVIKDAGHTESYKKDSKLYLKTVEEFIERYIN